VSFELPAAWPAPFLSVFATIVLLRFAAAPAHRGSNRPMARLVPSVQRAAAS